MRAAVNVIIFLFFFFFFGILPGFCQNLEFPPDPPGVKIIDRACETVAKGNNLTGFYAVMYNADKNTVIEIYIGQDAPGHMKWKKIRTWKLVFQNSPILLRTPSLISIREEDNEVFFSFVDDLKYREGKVHISLIYNIKSGKFKEAWAD